MTGDWGLAPGMTGKACGVLEIVRSWIQFRKESYWKTYWQVQLITVFSFGFSYPNKFKQKKVFAANLEEWKTLVGQSAKFKNINIFSWQFVSEALYLKNRQQ